MDPMDKPLSKREGLTARRMRPARWFWTILALITALMMVWLPPAEQRASASGGVIWSSLPSMLDARQQATATLLRSGGVLVVAGGLQGSTVLSSAALFDPATGTWTATGSMTTRRYGAMSALLDDGRVLVAGGLTDAGTPTASAEIYDPTSGTWASAGT